MASTRSKKNEQNHKTVGRSLLTQRSSKRTENSFDASVFDYDESDDEFDVRSTRRNFRRRRNQGTDAKRKTKATSCSESAKYGLGQKDAGITDKMQQAIHSDVIPPSDRALFTTCIKNQGNSIKESSLGEKQSAKEMIQEQRREGIVWVDCNADVLNGIKSTAHESIIDKSIKKLESKKGKRKEEDATITELSSFDKSNSKQQCPVCLVTFSDEQSDYDVNMHVNVCLDQPNVDVHEVKSSCTDAIDTISRKDSHHDLSMNKIDEDLARELQEREKCKMIEEKLSSDLFYCGICQKDLNKLTANSRQLHMNRCADLCEEENALMKKAQRMSLKESSKEFDCLICGMKFSSMVQRIQHMKKCCRQNKVDRKELLKLVKETAARPNDMEGHENHCDYAGKNLNKVLKDAQKLENLGQAQLEPRKQRKNSRKKKSNEEIPMLLTRSEEEAKEIAMAKATKIIEEQLHMTSSIEKRDAPSLPRSRLADKYKRGDSNVETSPRAPEAKEAISNKLLEESKCNNNASSLWNLSNNKTSRLATFYVQDICREDMENTLKAIKRGSDVVCNNDIRSQYDVVEESHSATDTMISIGNGKKHLSVASPKLSRSHDEQKMSVRGDGESSGVRTQPSGFLESESKDIGISQVKMTLNALQCQARETLLLHLEAMLKDEIETDVQVLCADGKVLNANKCVLFARCSKLKTCTHANSIDLTRYKVETIGVVLKYLYTSEIDADMANVAEVYEVASWLSLDVLAKTCRILETENGTKERPDACVVRSTVEDLEKTLWTAEVDEDNEGTEDVLSEECDEGDLPFNESDEEDIRFYIATQKERCISTAGSHNERKLDDFSSADLGMLSDNQEKDFDNDSQCNDDSRRPPTDVESDGNKQIIGPCSGSLLDDEDENTFQSRIPYTANDSNPLTTRNVIPCITDTDINDVEIDGKEMRINFPRIVENGRTELKGSIECSSYDVREEGGSAPVEDLQIKPVDCIRTRNNPCFTKENVDYDKESIEKTVTCCDGVDNERNASGDVDINRITTNECFNDIVRSTMPSNNLHKSSEEPANFEVEQSMDECRVPSNEPALSQKQGEDVYARDPKADSDNEDLFNSNCSFDLDRAISTVDKDNDDVAPVINEDANDFEDQPSLTKYSLVESSPNMSTPAPIEGSLSTPVLFSSRKYDTPHHQVQMSTVKETLIGARTDSLIERSDPEISSESDGGANNCRFDGYNLNFNRTDSGHKSTSEVPTYSLIDKPDGAISKPVSPCVTTSQFERKVGYPRGNYMVSNSEQKKTLSRPVVQQRTVINLEDEDSSEGEDVSRNECDFKVSDIISTPLKGISNRLAINLMEKRLSSIDAANNDEDSLDECNDFRYGKSSHGADLTRLFEASKGKLEKATPESKIRKRQRAKLVPHGNLEEIDSDSSDVVAVVIPDKKEYIDNGVSRRCGFSDNEMESLLRETFSRQDCYTEPTESPKSLDSAGDGIIDKTPDIVERIRDMVRKTKFSEVALQCDGENVVHASERKNHCTAMVEEKSNEGMPESSPTAVSLFLSERPTSPSTQIQNSFYHGSQRKRHYPHSDIASSTDNAGKEKPYKRRKDGSGELSSSPSNQVTEYSELNRSEFESSSKSLSDDTVSKADVEHSSIHLPHSRQETGHKDSLIASQSPVYSPCPSKRYDDDYNDDDDDEDLKIRSDRCFADSIDDDGFHLNIQHERPFSSNHSFSNADITMAEVVPIKCKRRGSDHETIQRGGDINKFKGNKAAFDNEIDAVSFLDDGGYNCDIQNFTPEYRDCCQVVEKILQANDKGITFGGRSPSMSKRKDSRKTCSNDKSQTDCDNIRLSEADALKIIPTNTHESAAFNDCSVIDLTLAINDEAEPSTGGMPCVTPLTPCSTVDQALEGDANWQTPSGSVKHFGPGCKIHPETGLLVTPMSDYEALQTPVLTKRVKQYGLRKLPKHQMIGKLREIYKMKHGFKNWEEPPPKPKRQKKSKEKDASKKREADRAEITDVPVTTDKQSGESSSSSDDEARKTFEGCYSDDEASTQTHSDEAGSSLPEKLMKFVRNRKDIYEKVLAYQKLNFDDVYRHVKEANIKCSKSRLTDFLDEQCICFVLPKTDDRPRHRKGRQKLGI